METKSGVWKGVNKSEKLSLIVLGVCMVVLATIILFRPF